MPKRDTETFFNLRVTAADGKVTDHLYKSQHEATRLEQSTLKEMGQMDVTRGQSFTVTTAESLADISNVIRDPVIALYMFNYGAKLYQQTLRSRHMKDPKWEGVNGDCDLIQELQEIKAEQKVRTIRSKPDELAGPRRELRKMFAKKYPNASLPTDDQINKLLNEILAKQNVVSVNDEPLATAS